MPTLITAATMPTTFPFFARKVFPQIDVQRAIKGQIPHLQIPSKKRGGLLAPIEPPIAHDVILDDPRVKWSTPMRDVRERCHLISPRVAVEASEYRDSFRNTIEALLTKINRFEHIKVYWWYEPFMYVEVNDPRKVELGTTTGRSITCTRMLVSFDMTNGLFGSTKSNNRNVMHRKGWGPFTDALVGYATNKNTG